jgi:alpha-tubulin suppressor-like RCC1 family protein
VAAGGSHSLLLCNNGSVFACGSSAFGQLGLNDTIPRWTPTLIPSLPPIQEVSAGISHNLALSVDGNVYSFGLNEVAFDLNLLLVWAIGT